jgi:predicted amidohydrolase
MGKFIFSILIILFCWLLWIQADRLNEAPQVDLALDLTETLAVNNSCASNVLAIQPYMFTTDYLTEKGFHTKMKGYLDAAKQKGYLNENTVVLLPEYLGTWLVIRGEKLSVAEASSMEGAMFTMIMCHPLKFFSNLFKSEFESDPFTAAIFRMKASSMALTYTNVFKSLAKEFNVHINAGSIVLPGPVIENNEIVINLSSPLYNSSFIFKPDGSIDEKMVKKSFPITAELPFIKDYPIAELPVFDLPIGKTALLICADSWYPESYEQIKLLNADIVLVNSYCTGNDAMQNYWAGYDGLNWPKDIDEEDVYTLTEQEAWIKYALPGRINSSNATHGVNVFLRGELWNLGTDGQPFFVRNGELLEHDQSTRAGIWNFCF